MENGNDIKTRILESRKKAAAAMEAVLTADPLEKDFFKEKLRDFVLAKFMLTPGEDLPEDFSALAEYSLSKSMKISPELVKEFDLAKSCDGVSSAMAKKVLLFLAIQKQLQIELPAKGTAKLKTLDELADLAWTKMQASPAWKEKISADAWESALSYNGI